MKSEAIIRRKHVVSLRKQLYGGLSIDQLKPHAVLDFFETYDKFADNNKSKTRSYEEEAKKFSVGKRTIRRWLKEYEIAEVFAKSKRGRHPKTIWALQNEKARERFILKVRELREKDPQTAKWFLPTDTLPK